MSNSVTPPAVPRFLFSPDGEAGELYITCTDPLCLIWVRQTIPAQLFILSDETEPEDHEQILRGAADFYRDYASKQEGGN